MTTATLTLTAPCPTLCAVATLWADHPYFDAEWYFMWVTV